jgi:hypothetical protein
VDEQPAAPVLLPVGQRFDRLWASAALRLDLGELLPLDAPLDSLLSGLLPHFRLQRLLAFVEVVDHNTHEHVEHEEADQEQEGDEVDHAPFVVVLDGLHVWAEYG